MDPHRISYGELVDIANNAIWQYQDMYLLPDFYANNLEKVRVIITPIPEDYKSGKITYAEAEFNARVKIYQSVNPNFNPDVEYMKICYRKNNLLLNEEMYQFDHKVYWSAEYRHILVLAI